MALIEPIVDSYLELIKCSTCLQEADQLKYLPCQHTICLLCVDNLTVSQHKFNCPKCSKLLPVPNGGLALLPDSLVVKEITELVGRAGCTKDGQNPLSSHTGEVGDESCGVDQDKHAIEGDKTVEAVELIAGSETTDNSHSSNEYRKDLKLSELQDKLREEIAAAERWYKKANEMMQHQSVVVENIPEATQTTKDVFSTYQQTTVLQCQHKVDGLKKRLAEETQVIQDCINKLQPDVDQINGAVKCASDLIKRLSSKDGLSQTYEEAARSLESLKELTRAVNKSNQDVKFSKDIEVGDSVRLQFVEGDDKIEDLVNGKVSHSSIGILAGIRVQTTENPFFPLMNERRTPLVIFPEKHDWEGRHLHSITKSYTKAKMPFKGDLVRVKASITSPHFSWKGVRAKKSRGILRKIDHNGIAPKDDLIVVIDFKEERGWKGLYSEIELWPGCGFEVGDEVRVSSKIPEPSRGWGGVNGSSVGKVKKISGTKNREEVSVNFPQCPNWIGLATELELSRKPDKGDKVQIKLSVKTPNLGWGGVTHEDVGTLSQVLYDSNMGNVAQVKFAKRRQEWSCKLEELELARYQQPDYTSEEEEHEAELDLSAFMRFHLMHQMGMGGYGGPFW